MARPANANRVVRTNTVPSLEVDRAKLRGMIGEAVDARVMIQSQVEKLNDIKTAILEDFAITKKLMERLINFQFNQDFDKVSTEHTEIFDAYEELNGSTP